MASKNESTEAMFLFAKFLHDGTIKDNEMPKQDRSELAKKLYRKAINKGSVNAMYSFPIWGLDTWEVWGDKKYKSELCGHLAKAVSLEPNHPFSQVGQSVNSKKCLN